MSHIILDDANKQYEYFMNVPMYRQNHLNSNITKINKKNNSFLQVIPDPDLKVYENLGYTSNHGLYDLLIFNYNANLLTGEQPLVRWKE